MMVTITPSDRISLSPGGLVSMHPGAVSLSPQVAQVALPDIFYPSEISGEAFFTPAVVMAFGPRGQGKTLFAATMAKIMLDSFIFTGVRRGHKVMSNFHLNFADVQHPQLVDAIMNFPRWVDRSFIVVDELDAYFPSGRAMTKASLLFIEWMKQIRKRGIELLFTAQYPQEIDRRILRQVDLFVKPVLINRKQDMKIKVWDWWGKFTGDFRSKSWPPVEDPYDHRYTPPDWEKVIFNVKDIFNQFRSYEVVAPYYSDARNDIMASEWQEEIDADLQKAEERKREQEGQAPVAKNIGSLNDLFESCQDGTPLATLLDKARKLDGSIRNTQMLAEQAANLGYDVGRTHAGLTLFKDSI